MGVMVGMEDGASVTGIAVGGMTIVGSNVGNWTDWGFGVNGTTTVAALEIAVGGGVGAAHPAMNIRTSAVIKRIAAKENSPRIRVDVSCLTIDEEQLIRLDLVAVLARLALS